MIYTAIISARMSALGMSKMEVAKKADVGYSTFCAIMRGANSTQYTMEKIAKALNVAPMDICEFWALDETPTMREVIEVEVKTLDFGRAAWCFLLGMATYAIIMGLLILV